MLDISKYEGAFRITVAGRDYQLYKKAVGMNLDIYIAVPQNQFFRLMYDSVRVYVVAIALIAAIACIALIFIIYQMTRPIKDVTDKLQEVKSGKFDTKLPDYDSSEFHEISRVFNDMTAYIDNLIKQVYEKQLSIKDMEMKFLQTQMNPHFMFNALVGAGNQYSSRNRFHCLWKKYSGRNRQMRRLE